MARRCATIVSTSSSVPGRIRKSAFTLVSVVGLNGVIAFAGLDLPVLVAGLDLKLAEGAVFGGIGGRVADGVLAAHLFLQFVEGVLQRQLAIHVENVAAGVFRHLS